MDWKTFMQTMMDAMMNGPMMWAMALFCLLIFVVLILAAVALVKYLFFSSRHTGQDKF